MNVTDALTNPVKMGQKYGYSQNNNGITSIVTGVVSKINEETRKVTLKEVKERTGAYGLGEENVFKDATRARTVYGCMLFPIQ